MGAASNSSVLNTGLSVLGRFNANYTEAESKYQAAYSKYQSDAQALELQKLAYQQEAAKLNQQQILQNLLLTQQQQSLLEDESRQLQDISQAAQAARAQVKVQTAANGVEGNSVDLAVRAVTGQAATATENVKYNTDSELASLQVQKMINREAARMGTMYYYNPVEPNESDYTSGLFTTTLMDVAESLTGISTKKVSDKTKTTYGLGKTS